VLPNLAITVVYQFLVAAIGGQRLPQSEYMLVPVVALRAKARAMGFELIPLERAG
jgi:hypothetical protein